jgi:Cache domain
VQISVGLDAVPPAAFDDGVDDRAAFAGIGIRSKEFGSSYVACVYTMFTSRIFKKLLIV